MLRADGVPIVSGLPAAVSPDRAVTSPTAAHRRAIALLALCGLLWSTGGVLIKLVDWHPIAIEPILSPLWVALAVGERPGPWALLGGAIVVGAVTLRAVLRGRARSAPGRDRA